MADFDLKPTIGLDLLPWTDPSFGSTPSRINPLAAYQHRYFRALDTNPTIEIRAIVNGITGPADALLGGRLFLWSWVEGAIGFGGGPVPIVNPPGFSSIAQLIGTPFLLSPRQRLILASRSLGGSVALPFVVEMFV